MARLWMAGAEIDIIPPQGTAAPDGTSGGSGGITSRDNAVFRSGLSSWKLDSGASNQSVSISSMPAITFIDGNTYYSRVYVRVAVAPSTAVLIVQLGGTPNGVNIRLRTDGGLELLVTNTVQGSPSASIAGSQWHQIEVSATAAATTIWSAAELRLDGASVATWSGSQARTPSGWSFGWLGGPGASTVINIDDVAINDSTGATNNTWCGSGSVVALKPTADSAVGTGWTNDNAATSSLFASVGNTPPAGIADTTTGGGGHQIRNATSNANVNYDATMTTYTAAGIGASDTINALQHYVLTAAPSGTSPKQGTHGIVSNPTIANVALDTGAGTAGAFYNGAVAGTYNALGTWKWSFGVMQNVPTVTKGTAPVMRITQVTASTRIAMVCGMFMYVDYTPAVAPAVIPDVGMALTVT